MERELWSVLYRFARMCGGNRGGWKFTTADILGVYFWAVVHDRAMNWSLEEQNWPDDLRPVCLPAQSTLSRRMRNDDAIALMIDMHNLLQALTGGDRSVVSVIDAKPLTVSGVSKDPDVGYGKGAGQMSKGYKLYAVWSTGPLPLAWGLAGMNCSEKTMARELIPTLTGAGYLLGDTQYDANPLYDLADATGYRLVAWKQSADRGTGHRRQSPGRLRSIALLKTRIGQRLYHKRGEIERNFGNFVSFGGGLASLPAWVRRITRVRNWVQAKLLINAIRWCRLHVPAVLAVA